MSNNKEIQRHNYQTPEGVFISANISEEYPDYYIVYKVIEHRFAPNWFIHDQVKTFADPDIRKSKKAAEDYYNKKVAMMGEGNPKHPFDFDPAEGISKAAYTLIVAQLGLNGYYDVEYIYKTTYDVNPNYQKLLDREALEVIRQFEVAQDNDNARKNQS